VHYAQRYTQYTTGIPQVKPNIHNSLTAFEQLGGMLWVTRAEESNRD
jgi:hypothetical protein